MKKMLKFEAFKEATRLHLAGTALHNKFLRVDLLIDGKNDIMSAAVANIKTMLNQAIIANNCGGDAEKYQKMLNFLKKY